MSRVTIIIDWHLHDLTLLLGKHDFKDRPIIANATLTVKKGKIIANIITGFCIK